MTATKETTLATSFIVILTVITTMTRKDDVDQGRSVITESSLNHSVLSRTSHGVFEMSGPALANKAVDCKNCFGETMPVVR